MPLCPTYALLAGTTTWAVGPVGPDDDDTLVMPPNPTSVTSAFLPNPNTLNVPAPLTSELLPTPNMPN